MTKHNVLWEGPTNAEYDCTVLKSKSTKYNQNVPNIVQLYSHMRMSNTKYGEQDITDGLTEILKAYVS